MTRSTPSYNGLINYILNENKVPDRQIFTHNLRSNNSDIKGLAKEFLMNESFRNFNRSDQIYLNHEIISFSALDSPKITPDILSDIMEKYVSLRGSNGVYLGAIHVDKEHIHLHIAVSGLTYRTGKSFYLPKDKLIELKKELQDYQKEKYPELKHSLPKHGGRKEYLTDREWQANKKEGRNSIKEKITPIVQFAFEKAGTQKEFLDLLSKHNLHYYERNGVPTGLVVDETKIRFTRLGISKEQINKLPMDLTEDKKALKEIEKLRQEKENHSKMKEEERHLNFEEDSGTKSISYSDFVKGTVWTDLNGITHEELTELSIDEKADLDRMYEIVEDVEISEIKSDLENDNLNQFVDALNSKNETVDFRDEVLSVRLEDPLIGDDSRMQTENEIENGAYDTPDELDIELNEINDTREEMEEVEEPDIDEDREI